MSTSTPRVEPLLLGALLLTSGAARAADLVTAESLGGAGAVAADPRAASALYASPAIQTLDARYDAVVGARLGGLDDLLAHGLARDSRTGPVSLSLGYAWRKANPPPADADLPGWRLPDEALENPIQETTLAVGLGGAFLGRRLGLGVSGLRTTRDTAFTDAETGWDAGVGLAGRPLPPLTLALGASNLLDLFQQGDADRPLTATAGLGLSSEIASAFAQLDLELHDPATSLPLSWKAGAELVALDGTLPVRLGVRQDAGLDTTFLTAGLGVHAPQGGLDYAIVQDLGRDGGASSVTGTRTWHSLSVKILLPDPE